MPWQRYVADVILEVNPATGLLVYREWRLTVPRQSGKALDCHTELLTTNRGWTTMADVRVGDRVFHPGGYPVAVTHVSDVMLGHDCYRVTTTDGRSVIADADHLWTVTDKRQSRSIGPRGALRHRWFETVTLTTRELVEAGLSRYDAETRTSVTAGKRYTTNEYRFSLPTQEPLKLADLSLAIDPYLLGAWLGDGTSASATLTCHMTEVDHWATAVRAAGFKPTIRPHPGRACTIGVTTPFGPGQHSRSFGGRLRRLGVLRNKHVPEVYLTAGAAQREALLQGLLDTDGAIDGVRGQVEFCSTLRPLADAVLFLARSLGWRATLRIGRATLNGRDCGPKYRVCFTPKTIDPFCPFRLPRKIARIRSVDGNKGRATLSIAAIEPVPSVPVRCIKVDAPDGLYLAGRDLIPTHNTTLILALAVQRALGFGEPQNITYSAQTRLDARKKWEDDQVPMLQASKDLARLFRVRKTTGNEAVIWRNGSRYGIVSATIKAGHGPTIDQAFIDEAFAQEDSRLEQAFKPSMITRKQPQLGICSTAGTERSTYLRSKVDAGRKLVEAGLTEGVAYFEWSAPDDADPANPGTWWGCMPALGHTVTEDAVRADFHSMPLPEFRRAYLNQWPEVAGDTWTVISQADWDFGADEDESLEDPVALALAVRTEERNAAIGIAGARDDGRLFVELLEYRPGTSWVKDKLLELDRQWDPCAIVVDVGSPAGALAEELRQAGLRIVAPKVREVADASEQFYDAVTDARNLRHRGDEESQRPLRAALAAAQRRPLRDKWTWERQLPVDQSPLEAVTLAAWGYRTYGMELGPSDVTVGAI